MRAVMNIAMFWDAAWRMVPRKQVIAEARMAFRRPNLSGTNCMKGVQRIEPIHAAALFRPVVAVVRLKYSEYDGRICSPFMTDESYPRVCRVVSHVEVVAIEEDYRRVDNCDSDDQTGKHRGVGRDEVRHILSLHYRRPL